MKLSSVAACLVFAVAAVLPFHPWAKPGASAYVFEVRAESDHSGLVQLYYDAGSGVNEKDSCLQPIMAGRPSLLRFALPSGRLTGLRLDPLDRDARMTFSGARIADGSGRTLVAFAPGQFAAQYQIQTLETRAGALYVETFPGSDDPQLFIKLAGPISIPEESWLMRIAAVFAALVVALLACGWAARSNVLRVGERSRSIWRAAVAHPGRAVLAAALLGTAAANYPVIFCGRSIVSPNLGVALLYGQNPWLPGFQSAQVGDSHKSDIAALMWHHLPLSVVERRALVRDGELPLWNRYDSTGSPLLGQGQSCFGDPLQVLPLAANGAGWAWDLKFLLAKWLFACAIGLCVWRTSRHLPAAMATAASVSFLGLFVYRINHPAIFSFCYAPWILYFWLRYSESRSARGSVLWLVALVGACWTQMNSGTVKEAYVLLLWMNFTGFCILMAGARPLLGKLKQLCGAVLAGVVFALLGSPVWFTFYRALKASYTSYNAPMAFQLQPGMFIGLFDEAFYRPFQLELGVINPSANFFIFVGLLWAFVRWRAVLANRFALGLLLSSLPALALVFGIIPPGLITRVPFLGNILHVDNVFSCALIITFAVLSGLGWREAWDRLATREGRGDAFAVVALLVLAVAAYLGTAQAIVRSAYWENSWGKIIAVPAFIHGYAWSLVGASAVLLWVLHLARTRGAPTPAAVVLGVLALGALHWREGLQEGLGFSDYLVEPTARVNLQAASPTIDMIRARSASPLRVVGFHNDLLPGWSILYDIEGISGPDALVNPYYRELMDAAGIARVWDWRYIVEPADLARVKPILDALNVRFYVGYREERKTASTYVKLIQSTDMDAFESSSAWPRAFFTDSVAVYSDPRQLCSWIKAGDGRPFAGIQRKDWEGLSPVPRVSGNLGTRRISAAEDYRLTSNTTSFTVSATGPGFIVLTEAYEKGNFHATVNGAEAPYIRVNHAFKGIYVGAAGTYRITFSYAPRGFYTTLVLFAAALGIIVLALVVAVFVLKQEPVADPRPA